MLAVIGQGGVGLGDIQRQRAQLPHVFPHAEVKGAVAVRQLSAAVQRPARGKTAHYGALEELRFVLPIVTAAVLSGGDGIAGMALALEHRNGRVRDGEDLAAAVGLFDGHLQVAAVAGRVEIVDGKRAGRHRALVDLIAVLFDRYLSGAAGNAVDNRGKPLLAVRQHVVIGGELRAAEVNAATCFHWSTNCRCCCSSRWCCRAGARRRGSARSADSGTRSCCCRRCRCGRCCR